MRIALAMVLVFLVTGCAQMRHEFREHPVRTSLIVGGSLLVGGYVATQGGKGGGGNVVIVTTPTQPTCSINPQACR